MIDFNDVWWCEIVKRNIFGMIPHPQSLYDVLPADQLGDFRLDRNFIGKDREPRIMLVQLSPGNFLIKSLGPFEVGQSSKVAEIDQVYGGVVGKTVDKGSEDLY
jgi:hypothetical protein